MSTTTLRRPRPQPQEERAAATQRAVQSHLLRLQLLARTPASVRTPDAPLLTPALLLLLLVHSHAAFVALHQYTETLLSAMSHSSSFVAVRPLPVQGNVAAACDSIHQTGTKYRSNNAGDGPEKTRDRKSWFPRFKSNWLGTYRSKQMFHCCECAVADVENARYKGAEGKHCACGRDQWHLAKSVEETEYNRRMEISKAFGGLRFEEAVMRLKTMGASEMDYKRIRCESEESTVSTASVTSTDSLDSRFKRVKTESMDLSGSGASSASSSPHGRYTRELQLSTGPNVYGYESFPVTQPEFAVKAHQGFPPTGAYAPEVLTGPPYDHLAPPTFTDEESFGELLQGILEDDPRKAAVYRMAQQQQQQQQHGYAPGMKRPAYATGPLPPVVAPSNDMEFEFMPQHYAHHQQAMASGHPGAYPQASYPQQGSYSMQALHQHQHQHHQQHQQPMAAPMASATFPSAM